MDEYDGNLGLRTRKYRGRSHLSNRPGFGAGAGCALHTKALQLGVEPLMAAETRRAGSVYPAHSGVGHQARRVGDPQDDHHQSRPARLG